MTIRCSQGHDNPDGSAFCDECGESLSPASGSAPAAVASPAATAVAAPANARLVLEGGAKTFQLGGKSEVLIGREDAVSNVFPDVDLTPYGGEEGGVSRKHAKITFQGGQYLLEDLNSTNFTFANKQKLTPGTPAPIKDGDELKFGRVALTFHTA